MSSGSGAGAEETPPSVVPEGSSAASAIAGEFPLSDKAGYRLCGIHVQHVCGEEWWEGRGEEIIGSAEETAWMLLSHM